MAAVGAPHARGSIHHAERADQSRGAPTGPSRRQSGTDAPGPTRWSGRLLNLLVEVGEVTNQVLPATAILDEGHAATLNIA